jgi:hypothetical protein
VSGEKTVAEKLHSELGASVSSRWMACPGSIRLSREVARPTTSSFAQEGTRAHAVAELCLSKGAEPDIYEGMEIEGGIVDENMVEHVRVFVDYCRSLMQEASHYWIERRFNLAALNPPGAMYGTADFIAYDAVNRILHVPDLKYGMGVVVEVKGNKQLRYYGLGAALSLDPTLYPIEKVMLTIVQPRVGHADGVIRSEEISYVELIEFAAELMEAARATQAPDAPLSAGNHCRFCPASGVCPEQRSRALAVAQSEFDVVVDAEFVPPAPETIPVEQFAEMLDKLHVLTDWASAMNSRALQMLERGEEVPGWKLVAKRATRSWNDVDGAEQVLRSKGFVDEEIFKPRDLKSPAQIEKLMKKKPFAEALGAAVSKESSGYKMARASDPAPAIQLLSVGEEFALLPPATEE